MGKFLQLKPLTKLTIKLILSSLGQQRIKKLFGVFKHGKMDELDYAEKVVSEHIQVLKPFTEGKLLELGPGESLSSAIIIKELFPSYTIDFIDISNYAQESSSLYMKYLGIHKSNASNDEILRNFIEEMRINYSINGLEDLKKVKNEEYDLVFSQAVLEHIYLDEFEEHINNIYRILKKGGYFSSQIDFKDHLGGDHFNLLFSKKIWESTPFKKSGFYTNRISPSTMINTFKKSGFQDIQMSNIKKNSQTFFTNQNEALGWTISDLEIESLKITAIK